MRAQDCCDVSGIEGTWGARRTNLVSSLSRGDCHKRAFCHVHLGLLNQTCEERDAGHLDNVLYGEKFRSGGEAKLVLAYAWFD